MLGVGVHGNGGTEEGCELGNIAWPIYLGQQQKGTPSLNEPSTPQYLQCCLSLATITIQFCLSTPLISSPSAPHPTLTPRPGSGPGLPLPGQKSLCVSVVYLIRLGSFGLLVSSFYPFYPSHLLFPIPSSFFPSQPLSTTPTTIAKLISIRATVIYFS